jgi:hypothetical protein
MRSTLQKQCRDGSPNAGCCAGNDCRLAFQFTHFRFQSHLGPQTHTDFAGSRVMFKRRARVVPVLQLPGRSLFMGLRRKPAPNAHC